MEEWNTLNTEKLQKLRDRNSDINEDFQSTSKKLQDEQYEIDILKREIHCLEEEIRWLRFGDKYNLKNRNISYFMDEMDDAPRSM